MEVNPVQPAKAEYPILFTPAGRKEREVKALQPEKALPPISVIVEGKLTVFNPAHPAKAPSGTEVAPCEIVAVSRLIHSQKGSANNFTDAGMVMEVKPVQPRNAHK